MKTTKNSRKVVNRVVLLLSKIYEVSYYIAQKYYNKANGVIDEAKMYIKLHTLKMNPTI